LTVIPTELYDVKIPLVPPDPPRDESLNLLSGKALPIKRNLSEQSTNILNASDKEGKNAIQVPKFIWGNVTGECFINKIEVAYEKIVF